MILKQTLYVCKLFVTSAAFVNENSLQYLKMKSKKPILFCLSCYNNDPYFVRVGHQVARRCRNCNTFIKWAKPEEYEGKWVMNARKKLF